MVLQEEFCGMQSGRKALSRIIEQIKSDCITVETLQEGTFVCESNVISDRRVGGRGAVYVEQALGAAGVGGHAAGDPGVVPEVYPLAGPEGLLGQDPGAQLLLAAEAAGQAAYDANLVRKQYQLIVQQIVSTVDSSFGLDLRQLTTLFAGLHPMQNAVNKQLLLPLHVRLLFYN